MYKISPTSEVKVSCRLSEEGVYVYTNNRAATYCNFPSAGPAFNTSEMAMDGSPLAKCGLSWPPLTAMPKPEFATCDGKRMLSELSIILMPCSHTSL